MEEEKEIDTEDEDQLIFIGLIAMMDPPREESKLAVEECRRAGIRPIMITGDHKITAAAIAKRIGILKEESEACEGAVIEDMSDEECISFAKKVQGYGGAHVLMTRGKGGQLLVTKDGLCHKGQAKLIQAVDTMGAGDSFFAAFLVTLLKEGWTKDSIITESMIEVAFAAAADFSGRNCLREGSFGMGLSIEM